MENKTKHTRGPWSTYGEWNSDIHSAVRGEGKLIASCGQLPFVDRFETNANARLMATAPELLGHLKDAVLIIIRHAPHLENTTTAMKKVIDKAEGRKP